MKIGILNTDAVKPEFAIEFGEYPDMFAALLQAADPDLILQTYEVVNGQYPDDIDEVDAYLITGSKLSVYDDVPWINDLKRFVQTLHKARKKIIGICFGHQLIAEALGGTTRKADRGWCVGVHKVKLNAAASAYGTEGCTFQILSNHQDQVQEPAPGSLVLAGTETCPIAMTGLGNHILTFQGHPEFSKGYARALLGMRRNILGEPVYNTAVSSLQQETDNFQVAQWILDFIADRE